MPIKHANLKDNKHITFIEVSGPNEIHQGCYAESDQRVLLIGLTSTNSPSYHEIKSLAISATPEGALPQPENLQGTRTRGMIKTVIDAEPQTLRGFVDALEEKQLIDEGEKTQLLKQLDLVRPRAQTPPRVSRSGELASAIS